MNVIMSFFSKQKIFTVLLLSGFCLFILSAFPGAALAKGSKKNVRSARTATLTWEAPTTFDDGSPLTNLAGYKIYFSPRPGTYDAAHTIVVPLDSPDLSCTTHATGNGQNKQDTKDKQEGQDRKEKGKHRKQDKEERKERTICTYTLRGLGPDPLYFAVSAYSKTGSESTASNELKK